MSEQHFFVLPADQATFQLMSLEFTCEPRDVTSLSSLQLPPTPNCNALSVLFVSAAFISKLTISLFLSSTSLFNLANSFLRLLTALSMSFLKSFLRLPLFSVTLTKTFRASSTASSPVDAFLDSHCAVCVCVCVCVYRQYDTVCQHVLCTYRQYSMSACSVFQKALLIPSVNDQPQCLSTKFRSHLYCRVRLNNPAHHHMCCDVQHTATVHFTFSSKPPWSLVSHGFSSSL